MLWIGNGVKLSHAADEVTRLSKQLCAPIVCTYNAMCAVDESFENFLGARSRHGTQVTQACIEEADCVILVGSSLTAISTNRWSIAPKNVVQFDILPEQIGRQYPVAAGVVGDAKASLQKLLAALKGFAARRNSGTRCSPARPRGRKRCFPAPSPIPSVPQCRHRAPEGAGKVPAGKHRLLRGRGQPRRVDPLHHLPEGHRLHEAGQLRQHGDSRWARRSAARRPRPTGRSSRSSATARWA